MNTSALHLACALLLAISLAQVTASAPTTPESAIPACEDPHDIQYPKPMVRPKYPAESLKAGLGASVELRAVIGSDGKTKELTVVKGDPIFVASAMHAARKWRFHPARIKNEPVETIYKVTVRFVLLLQEAETDLEIVSPGEEAFAANKISRDLKFDTPEGPVYRVSKEMGVTAPKAIYSPDAEFTEKARQSKEQGTVTISLIVGTDGKPRDLKVDCGSVPDLNEAALESVARWRFEPGIKDGKPVMVRVAVHTQFHLY